MSIYVRDYVDSYFDGNGDWIEDAMLSMARELEADGVAPQPHDLHDGFTHPGAVEDILSDIEWELDELVQERLDEIAETVAQFVQDNPESEED